MTYISNVTCACGWEGAEGDLIDVCVTCRSNDFLNEENDYCRKCDLDGAGINVCPVCGADSFSFPIVRSE